MTETEKKASRFGKAMKRDISIVPSGNNGFIVKIGCGTFVFETKESMLAALKEYLDDPESAETEYNEANHPIMKVATTCSESALSPRMQESMIKMSERLIKDHIYRNEHQFFNLGHIL